MRTQNYLVSIDKPFLISAFESFIQSLGIKAKKISSEYTEPQGEGDISKLFGTWKENEVDPKKLRTKAWKREIAW